MLAARCQCEALLRKAGSTLEPDANAYVDAMTGSTYYPMADSDRPPTYLVVGRAMTFTSPSISANQTSLRVLGGAGCAAAEVAAAAARFAAAGLGTASRSAVLSQHRALGAWRASVVPGRVQ